MSYVIQFDYSLSENEKSGSRLRLLTAVDKNKVNKINRKFFIFYCWLKISEGVARKFHIVSFNKRGMLDCLGIFVHIFLLSKIHALGKREKINFQHSNRNSSFTSINTTIVEGKKFKLWENKFDRKNSSSLVGSSRPQIHNIRMRLKKNFISS